MEYLKCELQVPILVAEEGRGWQASIIKYEQHIFHRRCLERSKRLILMHLTYDRKLKPLLVNLLDT